MELGDAEWVDIGIGNQHVRRRLQVVQQVVDDEAYQVEIDQNRVIVAQNWDSSRAGHYHRLREFLKDGRPDSPSSIPMDVLRPPSEQKSRVD